MFSVGLLVQKVVLVHFLQVQGLIDTNTDIVPYHQTSQLLSVNKNGSKWGTLSKAPGWLGEIRGSHEHAFVRFRRAKAPAKGPYSGSVTAFSMAYRFAWT
jgi:hypothetical protein